MELTEDQKKTVAQWVSEGDGLSEIQKRLSSELGITLTYMDVRFLVIDLGLELSTTEEDEPGDSQEEDAVPAVSDESGGGMAANTPGTNGELLSSGVTVDVDRITKPGAIVSGTVGFSDGVSGNWSVDQFGRLGLSTGSPDYKPSQEDLEAFQAELKQSLASRGLG
ncbi:MAG: hypothetical protein QGI24_02360 [Kiritimatiellia bacterium]|jgi:hypothetical protein|nr:hypothetical protein [Kiritimatiellia bacterium]MDP6847608.1 hypothetical protein [Kiritimatiellia bacterium]